MSYLVVDRTGKVTRVRLMQHGQNVSNDSVYWNVSDPKKHGLVLTRVTRQLNPHYIGGSFGSSYGALYALALDEITAIIGNVLGLSLQDEAKQRKKANIKYIVLTLGLVSTVTVGFLFLAFRTIALAIFAPLIIMWLGRHLKR